MAWRRDRGEDLLPRCAGEASHSPGGGRDENLSVHLSTETGQLQIYPGTRYQKKPHPSTVFLESTTRSQVDLVSLRHGPRSGYFAELGLTAVPIEVNDEEMVDQLRQHRGLLLRDIQLDLKDEDLEVRSIGGLPERVLAAQTEQDSKEGQVLRRYRPGGPLIGKEAYELVSVPPLYRQYMRKHLYIPDSDAAAVALASLEFAKCGSGARVLEVGAGTGALTEKLYLAGITDLTIVDPDQELLKEWKTVAKERGWELDEERIHEEELEQFARRVREPFDLLISQGVHHHIAIEMDGVPGDYRVRFLQCCRNLLKTGGAYVLSDEFLAPYSDETERRHNLDRWYQRVILSAFADGYPELAYLEFGFWLNDQTAIAEQKESLKVFCERLENEARGLFEIEAITPFGLTVEEGGGFAVLLLRAV